MYFAFFVCFVVQFSLGAKHIHPQAMPKALQGLWGNWFPHKKERKELRFSLVQSHVSGLDAFGDECRESGEILCKSNACQDGA